MDKKRIGGDDDLEDNWVVEDIDDEDDEEVDQRKAKRSRTSKKNDDSDDVAPPPAKKAKAAAPPTKNKTPKETAPKDSKEAPKPAAAKAPTPPASSASSAEIAQKKKERLRQLKLKQKESRREKAQARPSLSKTRVMEEPAEQASEFWRMYKTVVEETKMTLSDLESSALEPSALQNIPEHTSEEKHGLDHLAENVKAICPKWAKSLCSAPDKSRPKGSPLVVFVTFAANRALEASEALAKLQPKCPVRKLFAKQIKAEQQLKALQSSDVRIAVGTPSRLQRLCDLKGLNLSQVEYIILDCGCDQKKFDMFTWTTKGDFAVLFQQHLYPRIQQGAKLCLY